MFIGKDLLDEIMGYIEDTEQFLADEFGGDVDLPEIHTKLSEIKRKSEEATKETIERLRESDLLQPTAILSSIPFR